MEQDFLNFDNVSKIDSEIYQLAMYEVTEGKLFFLKESSELVKLQGLVISKFNYLKSLIQRGSITLEQLRKDILSKNGPFKQNETSKQVLDFDELVNKKIVEIKKPKALLSNKVSGSFTEYLNKFDDGEENIFIKLSHKKKKK